MNISQEFALSLFVQLLILAFFIGIYVATIKFMGKQIDEIKECLEAHKKEVDKSLNADKQELKATLKEDKQELKEEMRKYNNMLERMIICEQSTKSAHKRIDAMEIK